MIVGDLYVSGAFVCPDEADSVLSVDADAVLSFSYTTELFEAVARKDPQVVEGICLI